MVDPQTRLAADHSTQQICFASCPHQMTIPEMINDREEHRAISNGAGEYSFLTESLEYFTRFFRLQNTEKSLLGEFYDVLHH